MPPKVKTLSLSHAVAIACVAVCVSSRAQQTALPPPADLPIEFNHDIRPILENSCLRCHGGERPKSRFRLDNRQSALKGGNQGIDIIPGNSAKSPLIRYVAGVDPDIKMPPEGKGAPLTGEQIGLLRAWIDQGAEWDKDTVPTRPVFGVELTLGGIAVSGNTGKFRELEETREGLGGGVKHWSYEEQFAPGEKISMDGHYLAPDQDFQLNLAAVKEDLGFVHAGFEQWRRYYEDTGGYNPAVTPPEFFGPNNLYLTEQRAWVDFGLMLPNWPAMTLGYEYQSRVGGESALDWGFVQGQNMFPATQFLNERTHIIKFDLSHTAAGWDIEESARVELHSQDNLSVEPNVFAAGPGPDTFQLTRDQYHEIQGMNTLTFEKQLQDWWRVSAGYYYAQLSGDDNFEQTTTSATNTLISGQYWRSPQVTLRTQSHIFGVSTLFTPVESFSFSLQSQNEWTREEGFGEADLNDGDPAIPGQFFLTPVAETSNLGKFRAMQSAALRFTRIPHTVLFADAHFTQEEIGEFEEEAGPVPEAFTRQTDAANNSYDARSGFNTSPWKRISFNTQYRYSASDTSYNHVVDSTPFSGYPAFILGRSIHTSEADTKLIVRPADWIRTTLTYSTIDTRYVTKTDPVSSGISPGGPLLAGRERGNNYGLSVALTPFRQVYLSCAFTYSDSRTTTFDNFIAAVVPYAGSIYTLTSSAGWSLGNGVNLNATCSLSEANYGQNNSLVAVPSGLDFTRHDLAVGLTKEFGRSVSAGLRYVFSTYTDTSSGGLNNFGAQGVFATIAWQWR